ncbi:MAG: manganese transporter [Helicobacteraceae bacterium]|nr:manganese transporter [Helicobacteraceae bacterium]
MFEILFSVWLYAVVIVAIHAYFGLKIVERNIIFTDLAIGQAAAIGVATSIAFFHSEYSYVLALSFSLAFAMLIAYAQKRVFNIEAFIGLLYVLGASVAMLILSSGCSHSSSEEFSSLLASDILFTSTEDIYIYTGIYFAIALFIYTIYCRLHSTLKELTFFALFAITVTTSVKSVGVFVVFALLVAPAYVAHMQSKYNKLLFAILFGTLNVTIAIFGSYYLDLSTGYTIVFVNSFLAILVALMYKKVNS